MLVHDTGERPLLEVQLHSHPPHVAKHKERSTEQGMPLVQRGGSCKNPLGLALEQLAGA